MADESLPAVVTENENARRFREVYPDAGIENFYSDSHSDDPLARLAQKAWLVKGDRLLPW